MLRKVGVLVGLLVFTGGLLGADPQEKTSSKEAKKGTDSKAVTAKVVSIDAEKGMITVKTKDGSEKELSVGEHTKFADAQGKDLKAGIKDKRLAAGADVKLMLDEDGKMVTEVHLAARARTAAQGATRPRKILPIPNPPAEEHKPAVVRKAPPLGSVVKADAAKKQIIIRVADGKGKTEDRTIDVKEGVKLMGASGEEADVGGFLPGQAVMIHEKDGKVIELQMFKLGVERVKAKK
jgi:arginine repressor